MANKITIIGAGNGGQALAAYCSSVGYDVCLYNRTLSNIQTVAESHLIKLVGQINIVTKIAHITDDIKFACEYSDTILIVTPATAHRQLAMEMYSYVRDGQIILLNPGRTFGSLEFKSLMDRLSKKKVLVGEAQTLVYACRIVMPGVVNIIGIKRRVPVAAPDRAHAKIIVDKLNPIFNCFETGLSVLEIGLDNIGAIFHPAVVLFNAATIERHENFYFYRDMTPQIANFIEQLDDERRRIGKAFGIDLMPVKDWICYAYPDTTGDTLCDRMRNNPAYYDIKAPGTIFTRQLTEDIPTGLLPMRELAVVAGIQTPIIDSIISIVSSLLNVDFIHNGRTLSNLGLDGLSKDEIIARFII